MNLVFHPGFRIPYPDPNFLPNPDPGSRGQKGTGSRIRIRNTATPSLLLKLFASTLNSQLSAPVIVLDGKEYTAHALIYGYYSFFNFSQHFT
jgi:hypothetical protein